MRTSPTTLFNSTFSGWRGRRGLVLLSLLVILATFMSGFGFAMLVRPKSQPQPMGGSSTDFYVALPEGSTTITISDPRLENEQLARFAVERQGNSITGLPETRKQIAPRADLSLEDAEFFRHELSSVTSPSDSVWMRANRIRNWLAASQHRMSLPGLATRVPREAYLQMRQGKPVLCGNLAEIYVALCESMGLAATARRADGGTCNQTCLTRSPSRSAGAKLLRGSTLFLSPYLL
jgi:hypothetical protein